MGKRRPKSDPSRVYNLVWAILADGKLKAPAKCAGVALLLKFRNSKTGLCNPSFSTIGKAIGRDRRNAITAVNELEVEGWLKSTGTAGGPSSNTNSFTFPMLTSDELITPTGDELVTGDEKSMTGDELVTRGVMKSPHELLTELPKNYKNADGALRSEERAPLPAWAKPASGGKFLIKVESHGGEQVRRYFAAQNRPLPIVSTRYDSYIVDWVTPPSTTSAEAA